MPNLYSQPMTAPPSNLVEKDKNESFKTKHSIASHKLLPTPSFCIDAVTIRLNPANGLQKQSIASQSMHIKQ